MVFHIHRNSGLQKTNHTIHYMPCLIHSDRDANVSQYFQCYVNKENDRESVLSASFRGYPLQGQVVSIPHNYQGIVLREMKTPLTENAERNLHATHTFKSVTYWNWDMCPSRNDAFISALDWIDVAEALHSPTEND